MRVSWFSRVTSMKPAGDSYASERALPRSSGQKPMRYEPTEPAILSPKDRMVMSENWPILLAPVISWMAGTAFDVYVRFPEIRGICIARGGTTNRARSLPLLPAKSAAAVRRLELATTGILAGAATAGFPRAGAPAAQTG